MCRLILGLSLLAASFILCQSDVSARFQDRKSGSIVGVIKSKKDTPNGKNVIVEVLAPGEEKPRTYRVQYDPKLKAPVPEILKAVRETKVGAKVEFDWIDGGEGLLITKYKVLSKEEKPSEPTEKKTKSGTVVGVLVDKKPAGGGILIKADGEETPRRYWRFGDRQAVNKQIEAVPVGSRVRVEWESPGNEGPHIAKIEIVKSGAERKDGSSDK